MNQKRTFSKAVKKETLAEQVATAIKEAILAGDWPAGDALPTEPQLAEQFGVSRAVVRDATRMLAAQGLVEAQHGRGVFVTGSQAEAFGEALLLALRREGASVWDVEHFEQILFPEVIALAAAEADQDELAAIRQMSQAYLDEAGNLLRDYWNVSPLPPAVQQRYVAGYRAVVEAIFVATHNKVLQLLAPSLLRLRNLRTWQDDEATLDDMLRMESAYLETVIAAIASGDPAQARQTMIALMRLPPEAVEAMRQAPVGEIPTIPVRPSGRSAGRDPQPPETSKPGFLQDEKAKDG